MATQHQAPEQRTIDVDVEDIDTRGRTVVGYAAVYGARAQLNGFTEEIARGAFAGALDGDVRALLNHDPNVVLGRTKSGTLRLTDEQRGLRFELDLPESRADLREAIARGDLDGASFRFQVGEDRWDGDHRTVTRVAELTDITLATYPAYPATSIELRTRQESKVQEQQAEQRDEANQERPPAGSLRVDERSELPVFRSLADLYAERGFFENRVAEVTWGEFEARAITWTAGTVLTDLAPVRRDGVPLGYDTRWLYPALPTTAVDDATTAVQYLQQTARVLPGTAVVRPLDAVSAKPSVAGTATLVTAQLQQVAAIHPDVPRIHAAQPLFQSIIEQDLRLSINDGLDEVARRGVATAGTAAAVTGTDVLQKVRKAMTIVQSSGYNPNLLAIDPAGAEALDLLQTAGSEKFYVWGPGRAAPTGPFGLTMRVWKTAGTALLDADAFGRMYISPVELRAFEQDSGQTNRQTIRMETNAVYTVERVSAGLRII